MENVRPATSGPNVSDEVFEIRERRRPPSVADIVPTLARQFLAAFEPGSRLPTVRALAREHRSSNSSVHAAIGRLEQGGAIEIETRGRAGAFLVRRSIDRLWAMTKTGPLVIALSLASSPRYEALATAIKQIMTDAELEVILMFVRGSRQRLQAVLLDRGGIAAEPLEKFHQLSVGLDQVLVVADDGAILGH